MTRRPRVPALLRDITGRRTAVDAMTEQSPAPSYGGHVYIEDTDETEGGWVRSGVWDGQPLLEPEFDTVEDDAEPADPAPISSILDQPRERPPDPILMAALHANRVRAAADAHYAYADQMAAFRDRLEQEAEAGQRRVARLQAALAGTS